MVSGDVDPEQVKTWVAKYFGSINRCPDVRNMRPKKPRLTMDYYVTMQDNIQMPMTVMSFPTVNEFHRDEAALDILAEILGGGNEFVVL